MKALIKRVILAVQVLAPSLALAGPPAKYASCGQAIKIKSVANGSGVFFDESCATAYVLPPNQGRLEIKGLTPNMNLRLCGAYESALKTLKNEYTYLEKVSQQLQRPESGGAPGSGTSIDDNTSLDGGGSHPSGSFAPVDERLLVEYQKSVNRIALIKQSLVLFDDDKKGVAVGKINYFTQWSDLVEAYKKANPSIHFERLPLEAGRIVFARKVGLSGEIVTGAVAHTVQGIENTSAISPDGTLQSSSGSVIMGDAISGQVVLNFAGACPFVKNDQMPGGLSATEVDAYLAANFQYKYSLQGLRKYRASYNLASIAKHIQESQSRGGFFSSSTRNSVTDSNSSSDEFNMEIESNQASFEYDSHLRAEVKNELIARVLREVSTIAGQTVIVPTPTAPPVHGANVLAGELQKVPNIYAQVGAVALKVLDSIFGSSSAVAEYIRTKNGVSVDQVTEKRMFNYQGSMVFTGNAK